MRTARRALLGAATLLLLALAIGCTDQTHDAGRVGQEWFAGELKRIGYHDTGGGVLGTSAKPVGSLVAGDALEAQVREVRVARVRESALDDGDRSQGVTWRGQVFLSYELREQYHKDGQPRGWSEWHKESSILGLERRAGQWYVSRVK